MAIAAASDQAPDVLVGDWMSELNMPKRAFEVSQGLGIGYETSFLEALEPAIDTIASKKIKLAANAGTVATRDLYDLVVKLVKQKDLDLTVAWVEGDLVFPQVQAALKDEKSDLRHLSTGQRLKDWPYEPLFAQCYLGGWAIARAFEAGADIVLAGRVADASPVVGAAAWWHKWSRTDFDKLAQALIAGHLIECSNYVTGGNYTGFKSLDCNTITDLGYPIAEISHDGDIVITKPEGTGGTVNIETCKEQLLYEIQGPYYLNSDVTAVIDQAKFTQVGKDRVQLSGITGQPPPKTTKVGVTARGGHKAEIHWAIVGLDIEEKRKMLELQIKHNMGKERLDRLTLFDMTVYGSVPENPRNQNATVLDCRLVAQAKKEDALSAANFLRPAHAVIMQTYPAATQHTDFRLATPVPVRL